MNEAAALLRVDSLSKSFSGTVALNQAHFELREGEVLALAGENGAGKSTLIKILSGIHTADEGRIVVDGTPVDIVSPATSRRLGLSVIYQDFDLAPNLTVAENLLLGIKTGRPLGLIDRGNSAAQVTTALAEVGLDVDPRSLVGELNAAQRQLVAIARAISLNARVLIMDEPTSALAADESEALLALIARLRDRGVAVIFISHKLDEIFAIADRITVLRDGQTVASRDTGSTTREEIVALMVGRTLQDLYTKEPHGRDEILLEARKLSRKDRFKSISLELRKGEILGLYGLKGAGRRHIVDALFGLSQPDGGELLLSGQKVDLGSPSEAIERGIGMVPEDRKVQGLFPNMDLKENISIAALGRISSHGFVSTRKDRDCANSYIASLQIRTEGPDQDTAHLSGGNQQKLLLARWLSCAPNVLILQEPTAGIDVGARSELYALLNMLTAQGMGIILVSSDLPEVLGLSDRILVVHHGAIVARFVAGEASQENIMQAIHS